MTFLRLPCGHFGSRQSCPHPPTTYSWNDLTDNLDKDNSHGYINKTAFGFGLSSKMFPFIPYNFTLDYSVSDMGILGEVTRLTFTIGL